MFTSIFDSFMNEASIAPLVASYNEFYTSLGYTLPIAFAVICLVLGFFGRRLTHVVRALILFAIGFVASVYWLTPMVHTVFPDVPGYAVGIAVGLFAAVMANFIYNTVYVGAIGFDTYNICFNALFLVEITSMTKGNLALSLGIAFVAVMIALGIRKYLEMVITSAAGGIGVAFFANEILAYSDSFTGMEPMTAIIIVGAVLAVPMFIYQYYNRVIY